MLRVDGAEGGRGEGGGHRAEEGKSVGLASLEREVRMDQKYD